MENQNEIWKDVPGYEGLYQVSNSGRVKVLPRVKIGRGGLNIFMKEGIFSTYVKDGKYHNIGLVKDGNRKNMKVHRLVATAFISNPDNKRIVNHINGVKSDNRIENLEWATDEENSIHAWKNGLTKPQNGEVNAMSKLKTQDVLDIRRRYEENPKVNKQILANEFGLSLTGIWHIIKRRRWETV